MGKKIHINYLKSHLKDPFKNLAQFIVDTP